MIDLIIVVILLFFLIYGVHRGFMIMAFNLCSFVLSIILMYLIYPLVSALLNSVGFYDTVRENASKQLEAGIENLLQIPIAEAEESLLRALNMPDFFKESLISNNKPEIHNYLNAMNVNQYVSGFIANAIVNVTAMILVFLIVFIIMRIAAASVKVISLLPAVNMLNKLGGAAFGLIQGIIIVWLLLTASIIFMGTDGQGGISGLLQNSRLVGFIQSNNFIYQSVTNIVIK